MENNYTGQYLRGYNFREQNLQGHDFSGRDLTGAYFTDVNLENANFTGAILENAIFTDVNFKNAIFTRANLRGANLRGAVLIGVNLSEANFTRANLTSADLEAANLTGAVFTEANLTGADLRRADFTGADFTRAILTTADLEAANLTGADFTEANLTSAELDSADFRGADFTRANLTSADLYAANLENVNFTAAQLTYVTWERANLLGATFNDAYVIYGNGTQRGITMENLEGAENVETIILTEPVPPVRRVRVNAVQVHQYFGKIKVRKLIGCIKEETDKYRVPPYVPGDVKAEFVSNRLHEIALRVDGQEIQDGKIDRIMEGRLNRVQYGDFDSDTLELVYYALEFAKLQPRIFREMYIKSYTQDVIEAYDNEMSCAAGAIERIVTSLVTGALTVAENAEEFKKYKEIVRIINVFPIHEYVLEWYKLHNKDKEGETEWHAANNEEAKKESLKEYLTSLELFNEEEIEKATVTGYEEDDFIYTGGMRRRRTRRIIRKISKGRVTMRRKEKVTRRRIRKGRKGRKVRKSMRK
jgi:uncharacterized protein YjbI with pentapeptide repeats